MKTSGRKFGYTSLGCPLFRKFGKCCGRKESGHWFFFFQINSLYNACVIFQKNGTLQQYKLISLNILLATFLFTRYTVANTPFVVKFVSIWSMKSRISKRPVCCLKETLDSRAVVLSCPFSDLLFPTFNMHVDVTISMGNGYKLSAQ